MNKYNPYVLTYEVVNCLGIRMIFAPVKINRAAVPSDLYSYEIGEDDDGNPARISLHSAPNFYGTVISNQKIKDLENDTGDPVWWYVPLNPYDFTFVEDECYELDDYIKESRRKNTECRPYRNESNCPSDIADRLDNYALNINKLWDKIKDLEDYIRKQGCDYDQRWVKLQKALEIINAGGEI